MDVQSLAAFPIQSVHASGAAKGASLRSLAASGLYVHSLPGRLRVEAPRLKGDPSLAARIEGLIRKLPGVQRVEIHPRTGRVLVEYRPAANSPAKLIGEMDRLQCFTRIEIGPDFFLAGPAPNPSGAEVLESVSEKLARAALAAVLSGLL